MIINTDFSSDEIKNNIHQAFRSAATDNRHHLRFFSIATYDIVNNAPQSRMVVLRKFLPDWTLRFYTDYRSSKVADIKNHPSVSLLFWNPEERYQIRVQASATVHYQNEISEGEWQHVDDAAKKAYTTILAPGSGISQPNEVRHQKDDTHHFCVIDTLPFQIKVLQLNREDHLAMSFIRESAAEKWDGSWILP